MNPPNLDVGWDSGAQNGSLEDLRHQNTQSSGTQKNWLMRQYVRHDNNSPGSRREKRNPYKRALRRKYNNMHAEEISDIRYQPKHHYDLPD
jgi:hypothetical protein